MKACLLLLPLALAACMSVPESTTRATASAPTSTSAPISTATLARYHWQLRDAADGDNKRLDALFGKPEPDKPLQLDFTADRVSVHNACNGISGGYTIVEGHLVITQLLQTMMACSDQTLMQRETIIKAVLQGSPMLILTTAGSSPLLTLAAESGQSLTFAGEPAAQARHGGPGETMFLKVAAGTTPCHYPLIPHQPCLQVLWTSLRRASSAQRPARPVATAAAGDRRLRPPAGCPQRAARETLPAETAARRCAIHCVRARHGRGKRNRQTGESARPATAPMTAAFRDIGRH